MSTASAVEVESIEDIGILDGKPVKLVKTKGGFYIGVAAARGRSQEEVIDWLAKEIKNENKKIIMSTKKLES